MNFHNEIKRLQVIYGNNPATSECLKDTLAIFKSYATHVYNILRLSNVSQKSQPMTVIELIESFAATGSTSAAQKLASSMIHIYRTALDGCIDEAEAAELKSTFSAAIQRKY